MQPSLNFFKIRDPETGQEINMAGFVGPPGPVGPTGGQGPQGPAGLDGTSFAILGRYDTLALLQAAHPTGAPGQAYAVGSVEDNTIYIWSADASAWENLGPMQGPPGADGQDGANGQDGAQGPAGPGVPTGGTVGQVVAKSGTDDYATAWKTLTAADVNASPSDHTHEAYETRLDDLETALTGVEALLAAL